MGCDIHLHIEVMLNGKWEHYGAPWIRRNYALFAKMAGVRNYDEAEPISQPKGLPTDITALTKYAADSDGTDGHSHSWLSAKEIAQLEDWLRGQTWGASELDRDLEHGILHTYCFSGSFAGIALYPEERPDGVTDARFVFWFDN